MLDTIEEKHRRLEEVGQRLGIPVPSIFLELEVTKDDKTVSHHKQRGRSWTRNAYNALYSLMSTCPSFDTIWGGGHLNAKDTSGTVRGFIGWYYKFGTMTYESGALGECFRGDAGIDTNGILVGSSNAAESFEHYALQSKIANGTGAGQMTHMDMPVPSVAYVAGTKTWTCTLLRYFNNNSGGNVVLREVGLVTYDAGYVWPIPSSNIRDYLMTRDVLGSEITIPNTGQLKVTYSISMAFPY